MGLLDALKNVISRQATVFGKSQEVGSTKVENVADPWSELEESQGSDSPTETLSLKNNLSLSADDVPANQQTVRYDLTPEDYRDKWGLASDYPVEGAQPEGPLDRTFLQPIEDVAEIDESQGQAETTASLGNDGGDNSATSIGTGHTFGLVHEHQNPTESSAASEPGGGLGKPIDEDLPAYTPPYQPDAELTGDEGAPEQTESIVAEELGDAYETREDVSLSSGDVNTEELELAIEKIGRGAAPPVTDSDELSATPEAQASGSAASGEIVAADFNYNERASRSDGDASGGEADDAAETGESQASLAKMNEVFREGEAGEADDESSTLVSIGEDTSGKLLSFTQEPDFADFDADADGVDADIDV